MGRSTLTGAVPNPFFGKITDPKATNLKNTTVQLYRLLRPMPQFDGTSVGTAEPPRADSNYHALQVKWEKRYSQGLTMLVHYTWAKMIDDASYGSGNYGWLGGNSSLQNIWNLRGERALSSHDISHRAVVTGAYELPIGKGRRLLQPEPCARPGPAAGMRPGDVLHRHAAAGHAVRRQHLGRNAASDLIGDPSTSGATRIG
jgi:hypothetical protein